MQKITQTYLLARGLPSRCLRQHHLLIMSSPQRSFWGGQRQRQPDLSGFDPNVDYYKVLELKKSASEKEIKNMYYKKCYEYHPDRTGGVNQFCMHQDKFKEINVAYEVLSDEKKKKQYDEAREEILAGSSGQSKRESQSRQGSSQGSGFNGFSGFGGGQSSNNQKYQRKPKHDHHQRQEAPFSFNWKEAQEEAERTLNDMKRTMKSAGSDFDFKKMARDFGEKAKDYGEKAKNKDNWDSFKNMGKPKHFDVDSGYGLF